MGANHRFETLGDIDSRGGNLGALCLDCSHNGVIEADKLHRYFMLHRWDDRLHMIADHLKCSRCGSKRIEVRPSGRAPKGPAWGPRDERDWKLLVKRLRD